MKALAKSLDVHSTYFSDREAEEMRMRLEKEYQGVGLIFKETVDGIRVLQIVPKSPAEKSGLIQINDELISVQDKSIENMPFSEVMNLLQGDLGSSIKLEFKRAIPSKEESETFKVTLTREKILINENRVDVSYEAFGNGVIGKITLHSFYQSQGGVNSENDVRSAIKELRGKGPLKGLVLDLRDNSGGYLSQAVKVAGLFITSGVIVISKYYNGEERIYRDLDGVDIYEGPLVVLTSELTASAAEIVAEALQDWGVAVIAGDPHTYGKGSIQSQTVTTTTTEPQFKVTVGKYYTVSGRSPQGYGVKADIVVPTQYSQEEIGELYLQDAMTNDSITPDFNDDLRDVNSQIKAWYLKYYTPTLQKKETEWEEMTPLLRKNSQYRVEHNKNYQDFLKKVAPKSPLISKDEEKKEEKLTSEDEESVKSKNYGVDDIPMNEAVEIVKDMILLSSDFEKKLLNIKMFC